MRFGNYPKTVAELDVCRRIYYKNNYPTRFGQWLYNAYVNDGKSWPELFHETDANRAYAIAVNEIVTAPDYKE